MLQALTPFRSDCPAWLNAVSTPLTLSSLRENIPHILADGLTYLGSGKDWSPVRQTFGVFHSFLFFDCWHAKHVGWEKIKRKFRVGDPFQSREAACLDLLEFHTSDINENSRDLESEMENYRAYAEESREKTGEWPSDRREQSESWDRFVAEMRQAAEDPFIREYLEGLGIWGIYETKTHGRASVLFIQQEAIRGIAQLRLSAKASPRGVVIQDHAFGGNCWEAFGAAYYSLIKHLDVAWPEILIAGDDRSDFPAKGYYGEICAEVAKEAMHKNFRRIYVRERIGARHPRF